MTRHIPPAVRFGSYLLLAVIAITVLALWNGDSWLAQLRLGVLPAVTIVIFGEIAYRRQQRPKR
ncbi:hypothetical protein ACGFIU_25670 [Rhodococcus oryzae]|uniref:hypothetical protein n=1 Tax=Rhodococcus oryzae TaxID=2571143 RepID=UPI00371F79F8